MPAPAKADSVELLRRRTGTPRVGVPIVQAPPPVQAPVAGVIDPLPPVLPDSAAPPAALSQRVAVAAHESQAMRVPPRAAVELPSAHTPIAADDPAPRGKRSSSTDLHTSQSWYDEGDQLSSEHEAPSVRTSRARKLISPSTTDVAFYDEKPRRPWGLIAGLGVLVAIGGTMAFALTRGSSSSNEPAPPPMVARPSATAPTAPTAPIDAAPSTIIAADPPPPPAPAPVAPAAPAKPTVPPRRAAAPAAAPEPATPAIARRPTTPALGSFPIAGSAPTRRGPGAALPAPSSALPVAAPSGTASSPGLTDSPKDPYAGSDPAADAGSPDKKAEFFANLGSQQLIAGDTAGAAANFKKATELDGKNLTAILGMGEIALRQGLFGDAIAHLSKAAKLAPKNTKVFTLLGEAYLNSGANPQAAAQFKKALQLDPDNARARDGYNEASSRVPPPDDETP
jgi:WAS/WASL-interacting protein